MHPYCRLFISVGVAIVPCALSLSFGSAHGEVEGIHLTTNHDYAHERRWCYQLDLGDPPPLNVSSQPRYVILGHHKTGTDLWRGLTWDMQDILSTTCCACNSVGVNPQCKRQWRQCPIYQMTHTTEADARSISEVLDARVLHMVRRPWNMVVSEYVYASKEHPGEDFEPSSTPAYIRSHSLSDGVMMVCDLMMKEIQHMVQVHSYFAGGNRNVLEVRLEAFESDYNGVMRDIYQHFLGENDSRIDALLTRARDHDINRKSVRIGPQDHVSGREEKAAVQKEMEILLKAQEPNPCLKWVMQMDERMGYGSDSRSSNA